MPSRKNILMNLDWITILIYLFMVISGWFNIYSAVYNEEHNSIFDLSQRYGKQLLWIGFSLVLAFFILVIDSKFYVSFAYVFYLFFISLLVFVLFFGKEVNGAKAWFVIGSFAFQPAEFAKLGTSLALAKLLSSYNFSFKRMKNQLTIMGLLFLPIALIILQNDTGSALVYGVFIIPLFREGMSGLILFFAVYFAMLFVSALMLSPLVVLLMLIGLVLLTAFFIRKNWKELLKSLLMLIIFTLLVWLFVVLFTEQANNWYYILLRSSILSAISLLIIAVIKRIPQIPLLAGVFLVSLLFTFTVDFAFNSILEPHQQARINNLLGIESDPLGAGYNVNQSKIAIGSGGFLGKGFLQGTQTKYDFVPEQSTDFIFCTVGEEWGFVGTSIIVLMFLILLIRLVMLAERQRSVFSRVFGYSVASILFFHFAINIGMTIGLAPVIGIPLPFFSYGGSSLWFFTILLFIFLKLDSSRLEQLH
ncbi:rod shape-determining protein RodA [Roseimarinus sediminis]|uniref:rod shape-determining protein RodA n=1 Tax=Roseimarinus sediminis TaxID=1610899 RepID=UPI003D25FBEF